MPLEQENKADPIKTRDIDLKLLASVSAQLDSVEGIQLVVTGSYAIEALTGHPLDHEDVDVNIFTPNTSEYIQKAASILDKLSVPEVKLQLFKQTGDRLEYDVLPEQADSRRLEMQFVDAERVEESTADFRLKNGGVIPTVLVPLKNSKGQEYTFRVKSLPYSIATWVIRVSGAVENPKREIKESDLDHLRLLLSCTFRQEDVFAAMSHHPQMPKCLSGSSIFGQALEIVSRL